MAIVIPKELGQDFERWHLSSFDSPNSKRFPSATKPTPAAAPSPVPESISQEESEKHFVAEEDVSSDPVNGLIKLPTAEEIEQIHNEARAEGYQVGLEEGKKLAHEEAALTFKTQTDRLTDITNHFAAALTDLDQEIAEDILEFAVEVARQVVTSSLRVQPESLLLIIREAMASLPVHHGSVLIYLNPQDMDMVKTHFSEQIHHAGWRLLEDKEIQAGGCRVHAGSSEVDATVGTRWRRSLEAIGAKPDWLEPSP